MGETEKIFQQTNQPPIGRLLGELGEFVGHQARRSHSQDEEGDLTVFLVNARRIEIRELGLGPQGIKRFAGDLSVKAYCGVGIAEGLDCVVLAAKRFVYPIEAFSPPPGPVCLGTLKLLGCFIVTLAQLVDARAHQHGEELIRS